MPDFEIVRDDDPRGAVLEQAGYTLVGESWGARLRDPDHALLEAAVLRAAAAGLSVRELGSEHAQALCDLETTTAADYPYTPATAHTARDLAGTQDLWLEGGRVFGALDGDRLVGATVIQALEDRAETAFTSVLPEYRGKGIGQAVKAASILALMADGYTLFGTGGAGLNAASLGANQALGYTIEERWSSYSPPAANQ